MLKLAMIFTDKMVLQRGKEIPVWGTSDAGTEIQIEFDGTVSTGYTDAEGKWKILLPQHEAGCGYEMRISSKEESVCLQDVCVGEVWLAGGQSNMEYLLGFEKHYEELLEKEKNPRIRFFDYPEVSYEGQLEDFNYRHEGFWRSCTNEDLAYYSAVGYYFAENIQKALDVPVGIVGCNWGGTTACSWMDPQRLIGTEGEFWIKDFQEAQIGLDVEEYKREFVKNPQNDRTNQLEDPFGVQVVKNTLPREQQLVLMKLGEENPVVIGPYYERRPGGLYETMLKKICPYAIRGVIWYQGESDSDKNPEAYTTVFTKLIENWRDLWGEELPFLFVQLAPFGNWLGCDGVRYPIIRACQETVSKTVPSAWMASIGDAGMRWDIHPKDKLPVGNRLALLARGHVYGENLLCDAPELIRAGKVGSEIEVLLKHAEGLYIKGDKLQAMTGITEDGKECILDCADAEDDKLLIHNCEKIVELRFASCDYYEVNLYNKAGIPLKPFTAKV